MKQKQELSPVKYIQTKGRNLPIDKCFINNNWKEQGIAEIDVCRKHKNGNYTVGSYLVDIFCVGLKNTMYQFNQSSSAFLSFTDEHPEVIPITYNEVHNIIYGAIAYAKELGFKSHSDFAITSFLLEEDNDDIPLIEYEFGKNGRPMVHFVTELEANRYMQILDETVGKAGYDFCLDKLGGDKFDFDLTDEELNDENYNPFSNLDFSDQDDSSLKKDIERLFLASGIDRAVYEKVLEEAGFRKDSDSKKEDDLNQEDKAKKKRRPRKKSSPKTDDKSEKNPNE